MLLTGTGFAGQIPDPDPNGECEEPLPDEDTVECFSPKIRIKAKGTHGQLNVNGITFFAQNNDLRLPGLISKHMSISQFGPKPPGEALPGEQLDSFIEWNTIV